jgi:fumarylacetoacetase
VVADGTGHRCVVVRVGDAVLPLDDVVPELELGGSLNPLLAAGPMLWRQVRERLVDHLTDPRHERRLTPLADVAPLLPMQVGDYVDFYSSLHHATRLGQILRPGAEPLHPAWRHLPIGYHGRTSTLCVSGTPVRRPVGLIKRDGAVRREPTSRLDLELEVGFVVGPGNPHGRPIEPDEADEHVFGAVLVNDWSARDLQAFEYQPLGPMLGKSFATTVSPWVVPLDALRPHLVAPPVQEPEPDPALRALLPWALDLALEVDLNGTTVTRTGFAGMYWTFAQQLAHLTSNGSVVRPGDLLASGTVSGPGAGECGSLIEATWGGTRPLRLADGSERAWLLDGDRVTLSGRAGEIGFGEASGTVLPALVSAEAVT